MAAFRIGRKPPGPWVNTTPPIRGGVYRKHEAAPAAPCKASEGDPDDGESRAAPVATVPDSLKTGGIEGDGPCGWHSQAGVRKRTPVPDASDDSDGALMTARLSPEGYADWAVQREIDRDRARYPSLCPLVQGDIVHKYRLLHQRIQDEGFYDCPYLEYGKETVRYVGLFVLFLVALRYGWYMTSAVCLGLFWVCVFPSGCLGKGA